MARFYASIQGNRGEATRMGGKESGIVGHVRGWDIGGRVTVDVNGDDEDVVSVTITHGSNGWGTRDLFLGRFVIRDGEIVKLNGGAR